MRDGSVGLASPAPAHHRPGRLPLNLEALSAKGMGALQDFRFLRTSRSQSVADDTRFGSSQATGIDGYGPN